MVLLGSWGSGVRPIRCCWRGIYATAPATGYLPKIGRRRESTTKTGEGGKGARKVRAVVVAVVVVTTAISDC